MSHPATKTSAPQPTATQMVAATRGSARWGAEGYCCGCHASWHCLSRHEGRKPQPRCRFVFGSKADGPALFGSTCLQAVCHTGPGGNCQDPCNACNENSGACEPAAYAGACITGDGNANGRCSAGACKVGEPLLQA